MLMVKNMPLDTSEAYKAIYVNESAADKKKPKTKEMEDIFPHFFNLAIKLHIHFCK